MLNASVDKKKFSDPIYLFFTRSLSSLLLRGITIEAERTRPASEASRSEEPSQAVC